MLVGTLGASFLGGKGAIAKRQGWGIYRAREGVIRAGYGNKRQNYEKKGFLMPPHHFTDFEIQKYCYNESRFNGAYSRDNLHEIWE